MKKNLLLVVIYFFIGVTFAYSQSINYLHTVNGAIIPTNLPSGNYIGPIPYADYGTCDNGGWQWIHSLCSDDVINSPDSSLKHRSKGTTWAVTTTPSYLVVDLGMIRTFNELRVFQMFEDGKVTHAAMYVHPATSGSAPVYSDALWVSVLPESLVAEGTYFANNILNSVVTSPSVFTFSETTARYIKFEFRNDGRYGSPGYVEVRELKLFNTLETSINSFDEKDQIAMYPNPTKGIANIYLPVSAAKYTVEVYSIVGNLVAQFANQSGGKLTLDLTENTSGIYFVKVLQGTNTVTVDKLVIRD